MDADSKIFRKYLDRPKIVPSFVWWLLRFATLAFVGAVVYLLNTEPDNRIGIILGIVNSRSAAGLGCHAWLLAANLSHGVAQSTAAHFEDLGFAEPADAAEARRVHHRRHRFCWLYCSASVELQQQR